MDQHREATKAKKALHQRLFWFFAGAGVNYLLISTPFKYLKAHTLLSDGVIAACSMGVSASFFFLWNYFINFRTDARKRDALVRYVTAVVVLWAISSLVLWTFKQFNAHLSFHLGKFPLDLDIIATQACFGWMKFIIYHKWVFPVAKTESPAPSPSPSI